MKSFRPRELRLQMDVVRDELRSNPFVLRMTNRTDTDTKLEIHRVDNLDMEFANNYFFWNDTGVKQSGPDLIKLVMVPFKLAGDE